MGQPVSKPCILFTEKEFWDKWYEKGNSYGVGYAATFSIYPKVNSANRKNLSKF